MKRYLVYICIYISLYIDYVALAIVVSWASLLPPPLCHLPLPDGRPDGHRDSRPVTFGVVQVQTLPHHAF